MKTVTICTVVPKELKEKIEKCANDKNISRNAMVRIALSEYLERNK